MSSIIASQLAAGRRVDARHQARGVVELGEAHRLGQPAGRVDGQHHDRAALLGRAHAPAPRRSSSCRPRRTRSRRRCGCARSPMHACRGRAPAGCWPGSCGTLLRRGARPARRARRGRRPRPAAAARTSAGRAPSAVRRSAFSSATRSACSRASSSSASTTPSRTPTPAASSPPATTSRGSSRPLAAAVSSACLEQRRAHRVDDDRRRRGSPAARQLLDRVARLLHRHLLEQGHQVHGGLRRA